VGPLLAHDTGVFVGPPGTGKDGRGHLSHGGALARHADPGPHKPLLDQWRAQLALFSGVDAKATGQIGSGKRCATNWVDVVMIQSLLRDGEVGVPADRSIAGQLRDERGPHRVAGVYER
jgi:hypothetical protein